MKISVDSVPFQTRLDLIASHLAVLVEQAAAQTDHALETNRLLEHNAVLLERLTYGTKVEIQPLAPDVTDDWTPALDGPVPDSHKDHVHWAARDDGPARTTHADETAPLPRLDTDGTVRLRAPDWSS